jgi:DNA-binding transcriptional regulator LsrR (DeoR family)
MLKNGTDDQLRLAARLYYMDGLGQAEVAKMVKVSQAKVSRLLAQARERGIVRISVAEYEPRNHELEEALITKLGLKSAAVIKIVEGGSPDDSRRAVGYFGAPYVAGLVPHGSLVAIAGGRTIHELIRPWPEDTTRGLTVIQAMGTIDFTPGPVDAVELGRLLARRSGGYFMTLNTPAFVADKRTRDSFLAHDQIRAVWQRLKQTDVALVGIGTLDNSVFVDRKVLKPGDLKELKQCGAVGEICGRFYDENGKECASPWRDRVIGIDLDIVTDIPQVVGVVAGSDRSEAICAAVAGGLLKCLVIDEPGARALLDFYDSKG